MLDGSTVKTSFRRMTKELIYELDKSPEKRDEIINHYFNLAVILEAEHETAGACALLWECINGLYEKSEESIMLADKARLSLGGTIPHERLTRTERLLISSVLLETFKKVFFVDPFTFK